ncbi:MAG: hypothetical protein K0Q79_3248 [Flavipsychrobacter sp.]|jgi:hypothetical protein|nr:hypothetical protein [Flavipsychrobacter sp.]
MKLKLLLSFIAFMPLLAFGQGASLTIFSEDGDKFILYLNGQQQNNIGQTNLRLDGLSQPYYQAKIVFEDKAKAAISKNIPVNDPSTNEPADVVYKIKNKDGEMKLRYFSAQPVQPNYVPPADVYVVHYGQPDRGTTTVTQTTTTTTTGGNGGGGSVTIGFDAGPGDGSGNGGVNINMNVSDPNMNTRQTTTTTTTSYSSTSTSSNYDNQPANTGCQYAMNTRDFAAAKQTVADASFEETKLSTAKTILTSNCFNTNQVIEICKLFGFEQSKLDFAKFAFGKTTDPGNYFKVNNVFSFDASKTELNNYTSGHR